MHVNQDAAALHGDPAMHFGGRHRLNRTTRRIIIPQTQRGFAVLYEVSVFLCSPHFTVSSGNSPLSPHTVSAIKKSRETTSLNSFSLFLSRSLSISISTLKIYAVDAGRDIKTHIPPSRSFILSFAILRRKAEGEEMNGLFRHCCSSSLSQKIFFCCVFMIFLLSLPLAAEDPYKFLTWNVTYGVISPLGVKQQVPVS